MVLFLRLVGKSTLRPSMWRRYSRKVVFPDLPQLVGQCEPWLTHSGRWTRSRRSPREPRSLVGFWDDATEVLSSAVPHYSFPCWYTLDPATLLITSHYNPFMPEFPHESLALEYYGDDVNQIVDVARSDSGVSTMHEATGGDPSGSPRWQANMPLGGDQELVAALRTRSGGGVGGARPLSRTRPAAVRPPPRRQFVHDGGAPPGRRRPPRAAVRRGRRPRRRRRPPACWC